MPFRDNPGMLLRAAYVSFRRAIQAHCSAWGVTSDQLVLLTVLSEEDGITQKELGARSYTDSSSLTEMVRLLEKTGLIRRRACGQDGRARRVYLTAKGRQTQARVFLSHLELIRRLEPAGPEEARAVPAYLARVAAEMQALTTDAVMKPEPRVKVS